MTAFWVGGYGPDMGGTASGVGLLRARDDGSLEYQGVVADAASPGFIVRDGDRLLAACEGEGRIASFAVGATDGDLTRKGDVSSGGTSPCHVTVMGQLTVAANYSDGTLGIIRDDTLIAVLGGEGDGPRPEQGGPHAHASIEVTATKLLSLDLGADRIHVHTTVGDRIARVLSVVVPAGTGPRDAARHPSGLLHVLGELSGELLVYQVLDDDLAFVASVALPGFDAGDHAAAIGYSGDFVYVGIRGSDLVSVLRADPTGRSVQPVGFVSSEGRSPRHLVAANGSLHVANQLSNSVSSFRLDDHGMPRLIATPESVPSPTYLLSTGASGLVGSHPLVK